MGGPVAACKKWKSGVIKTDIKDNRNPEVSKVFPTMHKYWFIAAAVVPGSASANPDVQATSVVEQMTERMHRKRGGAGDWAPSSVPAAPPDSNLGTAQADASAALALAETMLIDWQSCAGDSEVPVSDSTLCKHTACDADGNAWPLSDEQRTSAPAEVGQEEFEKMCQGLDSTLFRSDKRGWEATWMHLEENKEHYKIVHKNMSGKYRAIQITCVHCNRFLAQKWDKTTSEETLQQGRRQVLDFVGAGITPGSANVPNLYEAVLLRL